MRVVRKKKKKGLNDVCLSVGYENNDNRSRNTLQIQQKQQQQQGK
jgi:hypothetical protein